MINQLQIKQEQDYILVELLNRIKNYFLYSLDKSKLYKNKNKIGGNKYIGELSMATVETHLGVLGGLVQILKEYEVLNKSVNIVTDGNLRTLLQTYIKLKEQEQLSSVEEQICELKSFKENTIPPALQQKHQSEIY